MDSDKYLEAKSMQRPPLFENDHFIYWKNRFETYVKTKDLDLWHIILNGDIPPLDKNKVTQILEVVPFEKQYDDLKKKHAKNNEAKMVLYNALPKKKYERIFMCKTAKDIWQSLLITHQESIDSCFARFNTIITSLKSLDEGFSSKNYVRKFLRALHPKWRAKVTTIKESKDLSLVALDELIGNQKLHEVVMEKDSKIYSGKKEKVESIALKAKKESSDDETYYDSLCEISLKIINKNKILKDKRDLLEKEILELNKKIKKLERSKEIEIACKSCEELKSENATLKETQVKFVKFDKSANSLREMLNSQKSPSCKIGLGFNISKASTSGTKTMSFVGSSAEKAMDESTLPGSMSRTNGEKGTKHVFSLPMSSRSDFVITRKKLIHNSIDESKNPSLKPSLKSGISCVCLRTFLEPDEWIKDNGFSKHMTGNKSLFSIYKAYDEEHVDNLAFNLLSVGQICDNKCQVLFTEEGSEIIKDGKIIGNSTLWHRRLGHANMRLIQSLSSKELVRNLPKLKYDKHFCDACKIGKQAHASHKAKNMVSTKRCLELLHMDLFGPSAIKSYGGNLYTLVVVDDYSRYTWTRFLKTKNEAFEKFEILSRKIQNQLGSSIIAIRTDHGREFDNEVQFGAYCDAQGITHNFSAPRTPQSNGVVERKNRTLQEMSRTMLNEQSIPQKFWCNAVDTSTYILNRILIRPILGKTPYEIFRGRKPSLEYFKVFGSKCFILNTKDYLTKFDPKSYEGVFLGYSQNSKAYVVLNKHTMKVEESLNVTFDESPPPTKLSPLVDDDVGEEEAIKRNTKVVNNNNEEDESIEVDEIVNIKESKNHPLDQVIGNLNQRTLRSQAQNHSNFFCFISTIEPKDVKEALKDESWVVAMQEELNQFVANDVWELVPLPISQSVIGTKWVFRNNIDENGIVSRNKARLVAQRYNQHEGIDYDETLSSVARL
ncbi:retrovirus-related pol polyprotein from transposon TNT 1-94 [Tanacetum coccineum]